MKAQKNALLFVLATLALTIYFASLARAVPAAPITFLLEQPDGTKFTAKTKGDEWNNWTVTEDGYAILKDEDSGYWVYARRGQEGELEKTALKVGIDAPVGIEKGLTPKVRQDEGTPKEEKIPKK